MPAATEIDPLVLSQLKLAYAEKFGSSPSKLKNALNDEYADDLATFRKQPGAGDRDLISDKTLRKFFSEDPPRKVMESNLNYLCGLLLEASSYQKALEISKYGGISKEKGADISTESSQEDLITYLEYIRAKCGTVKILSMTEPIELNNIFARVNILEGIRRYSPRTIEELMQTRTDLNQSIHRLTHKVREKESGVSAVDVVKKHRKLLLLGNPGSGKTTFLKYLALHVDQDLPEDKLLPVYIRLKEYAERKNKAGLVDEIVHEFSSHSSITEKIVKSLLSKGQLLILLDGLDEMIDEDLQWVCQSISDLAGQYSKNYFLVTCRFGACEYVFQNFIDVEMADFDKDQVEIFITNWFRDEPDVGVKFSGRLEENNAIKELTASPLILTMLCWIFKESYEFPQGRYSLYEDSVDLLLRKWDASRRIPRDQKVFGNKLSRQRKINMLGEIAFRALDQEPKKYFWKQWELEAAIRQFIENVPGVEPESIDLDSKEVLKAIESNHGLLTKAARGIYSFSHLAFQEFFVAQYILEERDFNIIQNVIEKHLVDCTWREVFFMLSERLSKADEFFKLMLYQTNVLVKSEPLQKMLRWLDRITALSGVSSSSWRAGYLAVDLEIDFYINNQIEVEHVFAHQLSVELREINLERDKIILRKPKCRIDLGLAVIHAFADNFDSYRESGLAGFSQYTQNYLGFDQDFDIPKELASIIAIAEELSYTELAVELGTMKQHLPDRFDDSLIWKAWASKLQDLMIRYLGMGYELTFSEEDAKSLEQYLYANNLLLECIRRDSYVSKNLRNQIIDHLLLPIEHIPSELLPANLKEKLAGVFG